MQKTKGNEDLEGMIKELEPSEDTTDEMDEENGAGELLHAD